MATGQRILRQALTNEGKGLMGRTNPAQENDHVGLYLLIVLAATGIIFMISGQDVILQTGLNANTLSRNDSQLVNETIDRLNKANTSQRIQAARWLGNREQKPQQAIEALGKALVSDHDSVVRATISNSLGNLAAKVRIAHEAGLATANWKSADKEIAKIVLHQFLREEDSSVRRCLVSAAGELNHPDAATVIEAALEDSDPAVREEAIKAQLKQSNRARQSTFG